MSDTLTAIRQRLNAASQTWSLDPHSHPLRGCRCLSCHQAATVWQPGGYFCDDVPRSESDVDDQGDRCDQFGYPYDDAVFIAHARGDIEYLLGEVDRLTRQAGGDGE